MRERDVGIAAVKRAGQYLLQELLSTRHAIRTAKGENDIETAADRVSGAIIKKAVRAAFPHHGVMLEESRLNASADAPNLWVVDSIAGTIHFDAKMPHFGINLALVKKGKPVLGINYFPYTDDLYVAEKRKGAYHINGRLGVTRRMHVNGIRDPAEGILILDLGKTIMHRLWMARIYARVVPHFRQVDKFSNSQEAGLLGTTKVVGYIANEALYWDFIAHQLIVEESGGKATDMRGEKLTPASTNVVYSNKRLHALMVDLVKDTYP